MRLHIQRYESTTGSEQIMILGLGKTRINVHPGIHTHTHTHTHTAEYEDLRQWSTEHYDKFWEEFFHFSGIKHSTLYNEVVLPYRAAVADTVVQLYCSLISLLNTYPYLTHSGRLKA